MKILKGNPQLVSGKEESFLIAIMQIKTVRFLSLLGLITIITVLGNIHVFFLNSSTALWRISL